MSWTIRPATTGDEGGLLYLWLRSFAHSRYGRKRGAHEEKSQAARDYWEERRPTVLRLLREETTQIICDPECQEIIWAFACTSPAGTLAKEDAVHYICAKRKFHAEGFANEMFRALLGNRLEKPCRWTHELVEFKKLQGSGLSIPESWFEDIYILSNQIKEAA